LLEDKNKTNFRGSKEGASLDSLGIGLVALAKCLSGHGSRGVNGPYDVIPESQDFFTVSMQWPDRCSGACTGGYCQLSYSAEILIK